MTDAMPIDTGPENRQRFLRHSILIAARLLIGGRAVDCDVVDLSAGGARVRTTEPLPVGAPVVLSVEGVRDFNGKVAWQMTELAGVEFCEDSASLEKVIPAIAENAQDERERRLQARQSVLWKADIYAGVRRYGCEVLNVSPEGAKLRVDGHLGRGARVVLRSVHFGEVHAETMWQANDHVGVRFLREPEAG